MGANNIDDIAVYVCNKFRNLLGSDDISDYELSIIVDSIQLSSKELSTSKAILGDRINEATKLKSNLNYMRSRLTDKKKVLLLNYTPKYNKLFTVLTRQNRPSKQAIESEIYYTNPDMMEMKNKIDEFDELIQFINDQSTIIDMIIRNMESRRYDL